MAGGGSSHHANTMTTTEAFLTKTDEENESKGREQITDYP